MAARRFLLAPVALILLSGCGASSPAPAAKATTAPAPLTLPIPADRTADDIGRFLGGVSGSAGTPFADLEKDPAWIGHSLQFEIGWAKFLRDRLPAMREFVRLQLTGQPVEQPVLFYPFGGPDILTAQTLFPNCSTYVLVGLEPPGTLPAEKTLRRRPLKKLLPGLRGALGSVLNKSFFITAEMDRQLRGQVVDGLLPVMLVQLVRYGNHVDGFRYISLDAEGRWVDRMPNPSAPRGPSDGVAIAFTDPAGTHRTALYFSLNLATDKLRNNQPFLRYLDRQGSVVSFFKSTSYMPHKKEFELIRSEVLRRSAAVVQDDSGIPYRWFDTGQWLVQLYGDYEKPYGSFRWLQQKDLKEAFSRRNEVGRLGFSIGYGFGRVKSNLLVARRKTTRNT